MVDPQAHSLPSTVQEYHSLNPLEPVQERPSKIFGYHTIVYRATSSVDGKRYALRRIVGQSCLSLGLRLANESSMSCVEQWRQVRHPGLVSVREAFTTRAFGDNCKNGKV